jgi:hypothetical protein
MTRYPDDDRAEALDGEPDDRLSAYLDGELDDAERAEVERVLVASPAAQAELAAVREVKALLGALPPVVRPSEPAFVQPSEPAVAPVVPHRARRRWPAALAGFGAVAAAAVLVVALTSTGDSGMVPDIDDYALAHVAHEGEAMLPLDGADLPAGLPGEIAGTTVMGAMPSDGDRVHLIYSDGASDVSVFAEPGELDWDALPDDGESMTLAGVPAWHLSRGGTEIYVLERDGDVIAIVTDPGLGYMAEDMAEAL